MNSGTHSHPNKDHNAACNDGGRTHSPEQLHASWREFIRYCGELHHGEIEVLKIQDGVPVFAEVTKKKVKFAP
jgi:hypothetical protein